MYTGSLYSGLTMLDQAFLRAKTTDPAKVAATMEGMKFNSLNGEVEMRKSDHQLQQGLFISRWEKAGGKYPMDSENTGYTFVPVRSEEHTSELQSQSNLVCRLLLEKKKH